MRIGEKTFDPEKVHFNLVKFSKFGKNFELVVDPDLAIDYKDRKKDSKEDLSDVLKAEKIFFDAQKGHFAPEEDIIQVFGTTDVLSVAQKMISEGEIQLTSEHREKLRAEKRRKIIQIIHRSAVDPKTGLPHPEIRIENAMNEAKVKISEMKKAEDQIQDVLSALKPIMPIKFDEKTVVINLPLQFAAKLHGLLKNYGKIESEQWLGDGSYTCKMKIPAGMQADIMDELNNKTRGAVQIKFQ